MKALLIAALLCTPAFAQSDSPPSAPKAAPSGPWDPATRMARQREAMKALAFLDGSWRGSARAAPVAEDLVQTERMGTLLDGTVRLVEGRGYDSSGRTVFNALGIISFDPVSKRYSMRAHAEGYAGDFPLEVRPDGFVWTQPAGPGSSIRYTATVRDGEWHEVGERIAGDAPPKKMFEMRLKRIGDSAWPQANAVAPR